MASNRTKVELKRLNYVEFFNFYFFQSNQSGIETFQICELFPFLIASNRTKVELKRKRNTFLWAIKILPIEPKWNWNLSDLTKKIEVNQTSNRTKVELKRSTRAVLMLVANFQSNQSGIETFINNTNRIGMISSNRTKVELKHAHNHHCNVCTLFQSNQSGIETWMIVK